MQVSIPVIKRKRSVLSGIPEFIVRLSMLGGFVGLVGYLAIFGCHHIH